MSGNKTAMETILRVIEENQDNMKEGEYLEAMNALRDLHRNQEHDEANISKALQAECDMRDLWIWVCVAPFANENSDMWYTSAKETMERWIDETTLEDLNAWCEHRDVHKGEAFGWCNDCSTCITCSACKCGGSDNGEEEEEDN